MLNHTYTSVKNANLVDCGKKQHIPSQPSPLLKENFLGEFRTELERKKVLANLGIATELSLEWGNIKGDIGSSKTLTEELDARTKYLSQISGYTQTVIEGIKYLETIVGGEEAGEEEQNNRLLALEEAKDTLVGALDGLSEYIKNTVDFNITELQNNLNTVSDKVDNITDLIKVSAKPGNALKLITEEVATHVWDPTLNDNEGDYREATQDETATHIFDQNINSGEGGYREVISTEFTGLYISDLSPEVSTATTNIKELQDQVKGINDNLDNFVTREDLGGGDFNFVNKSDFDSYKTSTDGVIDGIEEELKNTVKMGQDGHVNNLYVNTIRKENNDDNIKITDSFEVESGIPLDVRFVVKSLEELHSLKPLVCYAGMGVIVSNQASLYILREPANGIIDEEYIADKDGVNWKCPEDLVIEVLTQEEYDAKVNSDSINPNMFYYIHEEVIEEPLRSDFDSDEAYKEALDKWLRVLQQKYMSAVWGEEIEAIVAEKAPNSAIESLASDIIRLSSLIESIQGGASEVNLKALNDQVIVNTEVINTLVGEEGSIPALQQEVSDLAKDVEENYVTKMDITVEDPNAKYIFLKKSEFDLYETAHAEAIATEVNTKKVTLGDISLSSENSDLLLNGEQVALDKDIPIIDLIDNTKFETLTKNEELDSETYYYVYDTKERYVLDSEYSTYKTGINETIGGLNDSITTISNQIGTLSDLTTEGKTTLVVAINDLQSYTSQLRTDLDTLITEDGVISSFQKAFSDLEKEIASTYVTIQSITTEQEGVAYIFVKNSEFDTYKESLKTSITTDNIITNTITFGDDVVNVKDSALYINEAKLANEDQIPVIEIIDKVAYDNKQDKDDNTYYYITDDNDRYVLESEFVKFNTSQTESIASLGADISGIQTTIGSLANLDTDAKTSIILSINELVTKITNLTQEVEDLKSKLSN